MDANHENLGDAMNTTYHFETAAKVEISDCGTLLIEIIPLLRLFVLFNDGLALAFGVVVAGQVADGQGVLRPVRVSWNRTKACLHVEHTDLTIHTHIVIVFAFQSFPFADAVQSVCAAHSENLLKKESAPNVNPSVNQP
jgi:hypothetical protein